MKVCSIDGCERPSRGRGWCQTHWRRWRTHGDPLKVLVAGVDYQVKATCSVEDCSTKVHAHGYCTKHLTRWQKHGDPLHIAEITGRPLKGDVPTFAAVHKSLTRKRGKAVDQACVDCGGQAQEWSYNYADPNVLWGRSGRFTVPYSLELSNYDPRCCSCHRIFDNAHAGELALPRAGVDIILEPLTAPTISVPVPVSQGPGLLLTGAGTEQQPGGIVR